MNIKIKILFCLVFCLSFTCGLINANAQNLNQDKVLVDAKKTLKQSDVDRMIEFYEWAFDTKFTQEQREKFQEITVKDFRKDPVTNRKSADDLLGTFAQIKAADEDRRRRARENFIPDFVAELRRTSDEEGSKLLLSVYEGTQGNNSDSISESNEATNSNYESSSVKGRISVN